MIPLFDGSTLATILLTTVFATTFLTGLATTFLAALDSPTFFTGALTTAAFFITDTTFFLVPATFFATVLEVFACLLTGFFTAFAACVFTLVARCLPAGLVAFFLFKTLLITAPYQQTPALTVKTF